MAKSLGSPFTLAFFNPTALKMLPKPHPDDLIFSLWIIAFTSLWLLAATTYFLADNDLLLTIALAPLKAPLASVTFWALYPLFFTVVRAMASVRAVAVAVAF